MDSSTMVPDSWPCFECETPLDSYQALCEHLEQFQHNYNRMLVTLTSMIPRCCNRRSSKDLSETISSITTARSAPDEPFEKAILYVLKCTHCGMLFQRPARTTLRCHMLQKHYVTKLLLEQHFVPIRIYRCRICNVLFKTKTILLLHERQHHVLSDTTSLLLPTITVCPECDRNMIDEFELSAHVMCHKVNPIETYQCKICYRYFLLMERLQRHILVHVSQRDSETLECRHCHGRFLTSSALAMHIKSHTTGSRLNPLNRFRCTICNRPFANLISFRIHVRMHSDPNNNNTFKCPHCAKLFPSYAPIRKHIDVFHSERKHICSKCHKHFRTSDKLRNHLLRHSDYREFLCAICGSMFKRKDKLRDHHRKHHSDNKSSIEKAQGYATGGDMNQNELTQDKDEFDRLKTNKHVADLHRYIYKCYDCAIGFKRRGMLINHLASRHPHIPPDSIPELKLPILQTERSYGCTICPKVYKSSSKRKMHILKMHPGVTPPSAMQGSTEVYAHAIGSITTVPHQCVWCHRQYACKAKLLFHQRKVHQ